MGDKFVVTGDRYTRIDRKMGDIKRQLLTKGGSPLNPDLVDEALQRICEGNFSIPDLFVSIHRQIKNIERWNEERNWGLNEALENLPQPPIYPDTSEDEFTGAIVLVPYLRAIGVSGTSGFLSGIGRTLQELWTIVGYRHSGAYRKAVIPNAVSMNQIDPDLRFSSLRWEVIDLGANRGRSLKDVLTDAPTLPSAGILAAAAHFPEWVSRMDGREVPFAVIPGLEYFGEQPGQKVLSLSKPKEVRAELCLAPGPEPKSDQRFAIPVTTQVVQ